MNKILRIFALLSLVLSVAGLCFLGYSEHTRVRYGYVNTEKMLNSFIESQRALEEIKVEEKKWNASHQQIEDSLKAFEIRMNAKYEQASIPQKKAMKEEETRRIEELGRFEQASANKLASLRTETLQIVYQKINAAMADFAQDKGLAAVFASSNGSIVYGQGSAADLTDEFSRYLNERFR